MVSGNAVLAYTHVGYVIAGWSVTVATFGAYALWTVRRGRDLSRSVPPEERRWS